jgi:hypothetical protein
MSVIRMLLSPSIGFCLSRGGISFCAFFLLPISQNSCFLLAMSHVFPPTVFNLTLWNNRFTQADIHEIAPVLLDAVLSKIEGAGSPEKVAENDHLMKCAYLLSNKTYTRQGILILLLLLSLKAQCESSSLLVKR